MRRAAGLLLLIATGCAPEVLERDQGVIAPRVDMDPPPDAALADMQPVDMAPDAAPLDAALPEPEPAPEPDPQPAPQPEPDPQPAPEPDPQPAPQPEPEPEGPARYPADRLVSPLTPWAADVLAEVIADGPPRDDHVFSKIGASATVSGSYLHCFAGDHVNLGGRARLESTVDWFLEGMIDGETPYTRESACATVGWHAGRALSGSPSALEREIAAANPRFAPILYGTNDVGIVNLDTYGTNMLTLVDQLLDNGVIPILSTVMPRGDSAEQDAKIPAYNLAVRAIAQARQVPFVDLHLAIRDLPDQGLSGDLIHPSVHRVDGQRRACDFTDAGLTAGYNWRNLLTIEALHGLVQVLLRGAAPLDPPMPPLAGAGDGARPLAIDALPFVDRRDTAEGPADGFDAYPGCNAAQDESGPEWIYQFTLDEPAVIQAFVLDRGDVDIDLHLLSALDPDACLERGHVQIEASLDPGTYYLVADTFVSAGGQARSGEYLLGVQVVGE